MPHRRGLTAKQPHTSGSRAALGATACRTQIDRGVRTVRAHSACTPHAARPHPDRIRPLNWTDRIRVEDPGMATHERRAITTPRAAASTTAPAPGLTSPRSEALRTSSLDRREGCASSCRGGF